MYVSPVVSNHRVEHASFFRLLTLYCVIALACKSFFNYSVRTVLTLLLQSGSPNAAPFPARVPPYASPIGVISIS